MTPENSSPPTKTLVNLAWVSLFGVFVVLSLKLVAYWQTNSSGVLSDAVESLIDIINSVVTIRIMKAVDEPADEEHPYGHGKLEYFSVAFEGGLIALAAILIGVGATKALIFGNTVSALDSGLLIISLSVAVNAGLALYIYRKGKAAKSDAMVAKARHVLADITTTFAVIIGLGLVKLTGLIWIDAVAALAVALHLVIEGSTIIRQAVGGLIDEVDVTSLKKLAAAFSQHRVPGIIDIHHLKIIRSGRFHHIDAHMVVPEFWDVSKTHFMSHNFEKQVIETYHYDGEIAFHVDPCNREYCRSCDLEPCQVRQHKFVRRREFSPVSMTKAPVKDAP